MKLNYNSIHCLLVIFFISYFATAQKVNPLPTSKTLFERPFNPNFCATDFFHEQKMKTDAQYKARHLESLRSIKRITSKSNKLYNGIYQIPVVVHVMHKGEAIGTGTNISDADVKRGIEYLNNFWRKIAGTGGFGDGVDMKIEFALAIQDENGNCTDGIDRVDMSSVTAYADNGVNRSNSNGLNDYNSDAPINSLKEYGHWDPTKYYNVWLVDEIDNANCYSGGSYTAGYAYYASAHGLPYDGSVVLICSYLDENDSTWAHEMGHAFSLPHTFDGDNEGTTCGDDGIADTPKHKRTISIPGLYFECGNTDANDCDASFDQIINPDTGFTRNSGTHQDHMHNYMDYTNCPTEFTGGQRAVATAALTGQRASYLTSPGLTPVSTATVFFTSTATVACLGSTLTFSDQSSCTPNTYTNTGYSNVSFLWTFDNGVDTPITSTNQNPTITFANPGTYDVTLAVTNPSGTTSLTKEKNITVSTGVVATCAVSSFNNDGSYGNGVTKVTFNDINKSTSTFIPANAYNNFTCSSNTSIFLGTPYNLNVNYKAISAYNQFLEVWIDWDNSGAFETSNSNGINERVLQNNIPASTTGAPSVSITAPASAVLNTLLRMRVVSDANGAPVVCGSGFIYRADDYGVYVKPACTPPTAGITNNSGTTELTCTAPSISLTATGGVSYLWDHNLGIEPTIAVTEPGTYTVTVTSSDGCTDTESIIITENKPLPTVVITNNTGTTELTCDTTSINVTASGGVSYSWDNGLGTNATVNITTAGTYTVTATAANGCTNTESIVITNVNDLPLCVVSSLNKNANYGCGVTNVTLNTINKTTTTFIPASGKNNFICSDNTVISQGTPYNLSVTYKSRSDGAHYLQVWMDWDASGTFELSNANGVNELVFSDDIATFSTTETVGTSITAPVSAPLNTPLIMRVITEYTFSPEVCGAGFVQRADDYGITVSNTLSTDTVLNAHLGFKMYPNPAENTITILMDSKHNLNTYTVYDVSGKIVLSNLKPVTNTIDVSALTNGFYFVKVETDAGQITGKFIKK